MVEVVRRRILGVAGLFAVILMVALGLAWWRAGRPGITSSSPAAAAPSSEPEPYTGSLRCRECHERFYTLWATSHHGLAMQPFTDELARTRLRPQGRPLTIGKVSYQAEIDSNRGLVRQRGPDGEQTYPIKHVMGGKNVYYFLTALERGRLQVLPVAYDVRKKAWFDTAASGVRHFPDRTDEAIDWRDRPYTFNTSCFSCHVSQLSTNYEARTDSYRTVWAEPGINCETCHGPGGEHVRACRAMPDGQAPKDLKIIVTGEFSTEQTNAMCAPCHAKMIPVTPSFMPGDRYFDHYDLVTLEHVDFYPDGRDLGENYTYTLWRMSPCAKSGKLDCQHCHTSSGRYRFAGEKANEACLPCHEQRVRTAVAHTNHPPDSEGNQCVACHMPMTDFARMRRSDHSMRPPTPATTVHLKSPNACNLCHKDKDARWADEWVRKWRKRDYQAPVLQWAGLIDSARKRDWSRLGEMLRYVTSSDRDEIVANSLVRLLRFCDQDRKWPVLMKAMSDPSPLIRGSAADALGDRLDAQTTPLLLAATRDESRLVRVRAAAALAPMAQGQLDDRRRRDLDRAMGEFEASMRSRPDDASSHYNLGNYYMNRRKLEPAIASFERATDLQPDFVPPLVNASIAYNMLGKNDRAEQSLRKALQLDPNSAAASLNLGLLLGEQGRTDEAETAFRATLKSDPNCAVAAYNLGVLLAKDRIAEAVQWCRKASALLPGEPRYAYTLAFHLRQQGKVDDAVSVLRELSQRHSAYIDAHLLLGDVYESQGKNAEALTVYRRALTQEGLPPEARNHLAAKLRTLSR